MRIAITKKSVLSVIGLSMALFASQILFSPPVQAAYEAGRIIDDEQFLDARSMSIGDVQNFLVSKNSGLKGMTFTLQCYGSGSKERQLYSNAGARCDTPIPASEIIYYAAQIYGVSPKVILATMQKEQSLATAPNPTSWQLNQAMGYACPTSGSCGGNSTFPYQIDSGTWALRFHFERARKNFSWWSNSTSWTCGVEKSLYKPNLYPSQDVRFYDTNGTQYATVYINNAATSSFYCYTPHAYNNPQGLYGRAAYGSTGLYYSGSYNFVNFYELWFGSTKGFTVKSQLNTRYQQLGGGAGYLGSATDTGWCSDDGTICWQGFRGGNIVYSQSTGAWENQGAIRDRWGSLGYQGGQLGWPTSGFNPINNGGFYQQYERGRIYWSPASGAWQVWGAIGDKYIQLGAQTGALGYPTGGETCGLKDGGCYQQFQNGRIYWTASTGAKYIKGAILQRYIALNSEKSRLGYPVIDETCGLKDGGCYQQFQNGRIYWTAATNVWQTWGGIGDKYVQLGAQTGALGYPTGGETCGLKDGGCYQQFQNGRIYWTEQTKAQFVKGAIWGKLESLGSVAGRLSYPLSDEICGLKDGGCYQQYKHGRIFWSPNTGAWQTWGGIGDKYVQLGAQNSSLGYPTSAETYDPSSKVWAQSYQTGKIKYSVSSGSRVE